LFTPQEAQQLQLTEEIEQPRTRTRALQRGPRIVIQNPLVRDTPAGPTIETVSPTDLLVAFEADSTPVDMDSLQIQARKGIFSKSLTPLLRAYVVGTSLQARQLQIPAGRFRIEIAIADRNGAQTVEAYYMLVRER
jgi:hypothetical protein